MFTSVNEAEISGLFKHEQIQKIFSFKKINYSSPTNKTAFVRHLKSKCKRKYIMPSI